MKKIKVLIFFFVLSFLFCGNADAANRNSDFFVGDKFVFAGDLCETTDDTVIVTKDGSNCVVEFVKVGTFAVNLTAGTESASGALPGTQISGNVYDAKYKVTPQQLVDYINNSNNRFAAAIGQLMMQKDYKPVDATKYIFSATYYEDDGYILYRFGYDTDVVEINVGVRENLLLFGIANSTPSGSPATEYTSTRYTTGLSALYYFMIESSPDGDKVLDIISDPEKYACVKDEINSIQEDYMYLKSEVVDSSNYDFSLSLFLSNKVNEDIIALYNSRVEIPESDVNATEPAPEEEESIVNPETGWFVSILIISFMGIASLIIMRINKNRIYRI